MENATKALLIAAAVLVVILIISLGIGLFNMANEQIDGAGDLSEYQIQQFNDKFTKYEGTNVSGSDVNAMIKAIFNHNNAQDDVSTMVTLTDSYAADNVDVSIAPATYDRTSTPEKVSTNLRFTVRATYNEDSKLITTMTISAPSDRTQPN